MNGKKAKAIRKTAERATIGKPATYYCNKGKATVLGDCTRKTYKMLKCEAMKIENLSGLMNRNKGLSLSFLLTEFV